MTDRILPDRESLFASLEDMRGACVDEVIQAIIEDANSSDHEDRVAARKTIRQLVEGWQRQGKMTDEWAERAFAAEAELAEAKDILRGLVHDIQNGDIPGPGLLARAQKAQGA